MSVQLCVVALTDFVNYLMSLEIVLRLFLISEYPVLPRNNKMRVL